MALQQDSRHKDPPPSGARPGNHSGSLWSKPRLLRFHSVKLEITLIHTAILAVILTIFCGVLYGILTLTLYDELDNEVRTTAQEVADNIRTYLDVRGTQPDALQYALEKTIAHEGKSLRRWWILGFERAWYKRLDEQDLSKDYINFVSDQKISLEHSPNMPEPLLELFMKHAGANSLKPYYVVFKDQKLRVINYPFVDNENRKHMIQVGISPAPVVQLLQNWLELFVLCIPVLLVLTSFVGRFLASRILDPVHKIITTANSLSQENLSGRVESENVYKEMNELVRSFNDMIARLENAFRHIERFSSYLAHELKTPLTVIKGETELALMENRSAAEYERALKVNEQEVDKMLRIVEDLLLLSKMDYQPGCFKYEDLNCRDYFMEIYEQSVFLAQSKEISMQLDMAPQMENIRIKGDPLHLRRAFFNLIDNALKFTPAQGTVVLSVSRIEKDVVIAVSDTGPGIAAENLNKIFDRFFRVESQEPGSGLGLSIVRSIVKGHGGTIAVESRLNKGTSFTVTLPVFSPPSL